jgi:hypothetical protein
MEGAAIRDGGLIGIGRDRLLHRPWTHEDTIPLWKIIARDNDGVMLRGGGYMVTLMMMMMMMIMMIVLVVILVRDGDTAGNCHHDEHQ